MNINLVEIINCIRLSISVYKIINRMEIIIASKQWKGSIQFCCTVNKCL